MPCFLVQKAYLKPCSVTCTRRWLFGNLQLGIAVCLTGGLSGIPAADPLVPQPEMWPQNLDLFRLGNWQPFLAQSLVLAKRALVSRGFALLISARAALRLKLKAALVGRMTLRSFFLVLSTAASSRVMPSKSLGNFAFSCIAFPVFFPVALNIVQKKRYTLLCFSTAGTAGSKVV